MALNVDVVVLTQPGGGGSQTISLAADFDPKAIIVWGIPHTVNAVNLSDALLGIGFGTYRGSVVQQSYSAFFSNDGVADTDSARGYGTGSLYRAFSAGTPTVDLEVDLTSMQGGATSQVVINWVNPWTTASIRLFALILGGSDITDAAVVQATMPTGTTTHDVTLTGFGQPDLVFIHGAGHTAEADVTGDGRQHFGIVKKGEEGYGWGMSTLDAAAAANVNGSQRSNRCIVLPTVNATTYQAEGRADPTTANWPTDGIRYLYAANPGAANLFSNLFLKGTFQTTMGVNTAVIAGTPPVTQDNATAFAPKLGLLAHWNLIATAGVTQTDANLLQVGIGAYDGTTEAHASMILDDAATTIDDVSTQSDVKVLQLLNAGHVLQSEADGVFSGNNFRLSWNDIDTVARQYIWLAMGDAAAALPPFETRPLLMTLSRMG